MRAFIVPLPRMKSSFSHSLLKVGKTNPTCRKHCEWKPDRANWHSDCSLFLMSRRLDKGQSSFDSSEDSGEAQDECVGGAGGRCGTPATRVLRYRLAATRRG
ncbi:MAG TPA: hypothetical protein VMG10_30360, partial [Gemmataceae bacterium]|nr:hypothetical protein [Gemmataceae bacterium]